MSKKLVLLGNTADVREMRIGGGSLTQGIFDRPRSPEGQLLTLVMSLPARSIVQLADIDLPPDHWVSVFSVYSKNDYFLEHIVYHGDQAELQHLRTGYTRVFVHPEGKLIEAEVDVPAHTVGYADFPDGNESGYSKFGGEPVLLQKEHLDVDGLRFALQFYGGLVPKPYDDLLYMNDAVGYLYLPSSASAGVTAGLFFAQTT